MIVFFEPQCVDWQHEMVNAGLIELVYRCYPDESILFLCEKKQGQNINQLLIQRNDKIDISYRYFKMPLEIKDNYELTEFYLKLMVAILEEYDEKISTFFLTSSHRGNMRAVCECAKQYSYVHFVVVVHALMENVLKKQSVEEWRKGRDLLRTIKNLAGKENVDFVTYSPLLQKRLSRKLKKNYLEKFHFLHHPYQFYNPRGDQKLLKNEINYGIIGACNNETAREIVLQVTHDANIKCNIIIMASDLIKERDSRVIVVENGQRVSREEMLAFFKRLSYFLIPYRRNQYMISASGFFWDAINEEIPTIILDCPYTKHYNDIYNIGWQFSTIEEVVLFMKKSIGSDNPEWLEKQGNIKKMKQKVIDENLEKVKCLIGE